MKLNCKDKDKELYVSNGYGPIFGYATDLYISHNCN